LLIDELNQLRGWFMYFERNNDIWFAVIIDSLLHGRKLGTKLLTLAKSKTKDLNGWITEHNNEFRKRRSIYFFSQLL